MLSTRRIQWQQTRVTNLIVSRH